MLLLFPLVVFAGKLQFVFLLLYRGFKSFLSIGLSGINPRKKTTLSQHYENPFARGRLRLESAMNLSPLLSLKEPPHLPLPLYFPPSLVTLEAEPNAFQWTDLCSNGSLLSNLLNVV